MSKIRDGLKAQSEKPEIDDTLAEILLGYHFLSDQRQLAIGMSGGVPFSIPITEMVAYCDVFLPLVNRRHFVRVIRAADQTYIGLQSDTQKQKQKPKSKGTSSGGVFPKL